MRPTRPAWQLFGAVALLLYTVGLGLQALLGVWGLIGTELLIFGATLWAVRRRGYGLFVLRFEPVAAGIVVIAVAIGVAGFFAASSFDTLLRIGVQRVVGGSGDALELPAVQGVAAKAALALAAIVMAGVCEETLFRGYLLSHFVVAYRPLVASIIVGILFALVHPDPAGMPTRAILGVMLGLMTLRTGSLWPAIAAHAVNNACGVYVSLAAGPAPAGQTQAQRIAEAARHLGTLFLTLVIALAALALAWLLLRRFTRDASLRLQYFRREMQAALAASEQAREVAQRNGHPVLLIGSVVLLLAAAAVTFVVASLSPARRQAHPALFLRATAFALERSSLTEAQRRPIVDELARLAARVGRGEADPAYAVWAVEEDVAWLARPTRAVVKRDLERAQERLAGLTSDEPPRAEITLPITSGWTPVPIAVLPGQRIRMTALGRWHPAGAPAPVGPNGTTLDVRRYDPRCPHAALIARRSPDGAPSCVRGSTTFVASATGQGGRFELRPNVEPEGTTAGVGALTIRFR